MSALRTPPRRAVAAPALAVALVLALRAPFATLPFGIDEGGVSFVARQWGTGHGSLYGAYWLDRPPLLLALYDVAARGGELGVRALGAAAAVALVVVASALAGLLGGRGAAALAAVVTAAFAGSAALAAVYTPAELLAAVPAAASITCLVAAHRSGHDRWLLAAGVLAVAALMIKQSFLDAGTAGVVFLAASAIRSRSVGTRSAAYATGVLAALLPLTLLHVSGHGLAYALFGFRLHALAVLAGSGLPMQQRVTALLGPALGSGMLLALPLVPLGLVALRRDRVLEATFVAWLLAGVAGVLAGGTYWPHYLIQLAAPVAVLAGVALARAPVAAAAAATAAVAAVAIAVTGVRADTFRAAPPHHRELRIARFIRGHARPGDTQYVLYARANLDYDTGLPSPYPYEWSLMDRAVPGAIPRLRRLLASPRRPTWIVEWQPPASWGLDRSGATRRELRDAYRRVATVAGKPVLLRRELLARRHLSPRPRSRT
jgi:hypothetical protein